uniref:renin receptor-like isoform X2 n=1 Tax=Styela clava TaxID=7725 RepID=UPI00193987A0|nr:renin receptor-like isoform X2 [Styela clava]
MDGLRIFVCLALISTCLGEFYIASAPKTMKFIPRTDQTVRRRELPGIINFMMGLPAQYLHRTETWPGLQSIDLFNPPTANVLITLHLPKGNDFALSKHIIKYTTDNLESSIPPIFEMNSALISDYSSQSVIRSFVLPDQFKGSNIDRADVLQMRKRIMEEDAIIRSLPITIISLNTNNDEDCHFFEELQMLMDAVTQLRETDTEAKQSVHVLLTSLDILSQRYGPTSPQVKEAIKLFEYYIPQFIESLEGVYHGKVLCEVDVTGAAPAVSDYLIRHTRSLQQAAVPASSGNAVNFTQLNLAEPNTAEFAVMFSIMLWLMIGFFIAVLVVTYNMFFMDPGKDNIIYRVTSQRIKMD